MHNRIGALPYSHHVRARNSEEVDGVWTYSGLWGYEVQNLFALLVQPDL